jgi:sugar lactone lactonase YvrE
MNSLPCSLCSTVRAAAFPFVFINLRKRNCFPVQCGVLALMLSGVCVGIHAQTASNGKFGSVNVGSTSATPISITFTFVAAETLGSTAVVTQGATGLDFANAGTGTCKAGTAYTAGETCTVNVSFTPKFAGTRYGAAALLDGSGNVLATGYLQGTGVGPQVTFLPAPQSLVTNYARNGLNSPLGVAVDGSGNVYVADAQNARVLKETLSAGSYTQSVVANYVDNGVVQPAGVAVDGNGSVYISNSIFDSGSYEVLKETLTAGSYTQSVVANSANNGLGRPYGVAVDGSGNVYVADYGNARVLKETLSAGSYTQSIVANAAADGLTGPVGVAVDGNGNVYITDGPTGSTTGPYNSRVLKETLSAAGYTQSVIADAATNGLNYPQWVAVDGIGNVYVADTGNSQVLKETLSAGGYTQSVISSTAINDLHSPEGVAVDGSGNLYIAEYYGDSGDSSQVSKEDLADPPSLTFASTAVGATSTDSPKTVTVANVGNAALIFPLLGSGDNPSVPANFDWDPSSTCVQTTAGSSAPFELAGGTSCTMALDFKPTLTGNISGIAELTDNNLNVTGAVQRMQLTGLQGSQTITFLPLDSRVYFGVPPITLSATGGASGNPVIFSIVSGPGSLSGTNNSVLNLTGAGAVVIAANQAGNRDYAAAPQVTQSITVLLSATLTSPAPNSTLTGSNVTFTWLAATDVTEYYLFLGSNGVGSNNLYNSGYTTHKSVNVTGLPVNGETVYARLYSFSGGAWHYLDYTYTAESLATLTSPAPNSTLTGSSETFTWSGGAGITLYYLFLGSNGVGSDNLYNSGYTTHNSVNVTGLPVNGETVYARLYWYVDGAWHHLDYTYTAV